MLPPLEALRAARYTIRNLLRRAPDPDAARVLDEIEKLIEALEAKERRGRPVPGLEAREKGYGV